MKAELIDVMGDDVRVANAARVSFGKESEWLDAQQVEFDDDDNTIPVGERFKMLNPKDGKLINYLAKHGHWTPFSHVMITMRETVPIFVARQRFKHKVGFTENEISRRYVDDTPEFYTPDVWRGKPTGGAKQGSSDEEITHVKCAGDKVAIEEWYAGSLMMAEETYTRMIEAGVAPEQARMVLPQSMYTSYYVTGSLAAWARAWRLRSDAHAQVEIQELADQWNDIIGSLPELKYSWQALTTAENK